MDQAGGTDQGVRLAEIEQLGKKSACGGRRPPTFCWSPMIVLMV
ncbi:MAG: hypothetical protein M5U19_14835 [Microthrixaceae bacterium]|nr:hypothetical protein [Microthrixaceae bacterium]